MFLLDTNVISGLLKFGSGRADARVVTLAQGVDAAALFILAICLL